MKDQLEIAEKALNKKELDVTRAIAQTALDKSTAVETSVAALEHTVQDLKTQIHEVRASGTYTAASTGSTRRSPPAPAAPEVCAPSPPAVPEMRAPSPHAWAVPEPPAAPSGPPTGPAEPPTEAQPALPEPAAPVEPPTTAPMEPPMEPPTEPHAVCGLPPLEDQLEYGPTRLARAALAFIEQTSYKPVKVNLRELHSTARVVRQRVLGRAGTPEQQAACRAWPVQSVADEFF